MNIENIKFYKNHNYDKSQGVYCIKGLLDMYLEKYGDVRIVILPGNIAHFVYDTSMTFNSYGDLENCYYMKDYASSSTFTEKFDCLKEKRKRLITINNLLGI